MALGLDRALERVERRVEAVGQARELVAAAHLQSLGKVQAAGERLGPAGEAGDRRERRARDQRTEQRRDRDPGQAHDEEDQQYPAELVIDLGERPRDDHRAPRASDREHAQVGSLDGPVAQGPPAAAFRDRRVLGARRYRRRGALTARDEDLPLAEMNWT